ncbi:MAG TPA: DUF3662 and FHA domain-containing protein [Solirubrobacteraceae bacterium]|nr:DUF3662 and FHA domain-containing protein [Solirubrobacteraceae bacterium]
MNPLKSVETMIANLVEGSFGRVFRTEVRPMELARKLAREMDSHRTVSLSRVYVPNEYSVWLSPRDRERYAGVEHEVIDELCAHLLEHARREQLIMASPPHIAFHTDERLSLGEFGIQARLAPHEPERAGAYEAQAEQYPAQQPSAPQHGQTMIYSGAARVHGAVEEARPEGHGQAPRSPRRALLALGGRRLIVPPAGGTIGRSRECDVVLEDAGISRRHARILAGPDGWTVEDLGSTNGVRVNGEQLRGARVLAPGDKVELGSTELVFELS